MGNRKKDGSQAGAIASTGPGEEFSLISDEKLISLYRNLLKWQQTGRRGVNSTSAFVVEQGHEAAVVGTAIDLGRGDVICSLDSELLAAVAREDALESLLFDSARGAKKSGGPNGHTGTTFVHAVIGTALANKTAKNGKVAVLYCNGKSPGVLQGAIHVAAVHTLPMIFVQQLDSRTSRRAKGFGVKEPKRKQADETPWYPRIAVDTDDLVAVYRVAYESISRARLGRGPTLIECHTFRASAGSKNGRGGRDSVEHMEHYLRAKGLFDSKSRRETKVESRV